jgi:predicted ester cyclase
MGTQENKASARRFLEEVMNQGDVAVIDEVSSPDFEDHTSPPGVPPGNEGFKAFVGAFRTAFPDLHYTIDDELAEGDKVVQRVTGSGTMRGDFQGMPASGKSATWGEIHITRFENGKAVEHWGVVDQFAMFVQLGFVEAPGQPAGFAG